MTNTLHSNNDKAKVGLSISAAVLTLNLRKETHLITTIYIHHVNTTLTNYYYITRWGWGSNKSVVHMRDQRNATKGLFFEANDSSRLGVKMCMF